MIGRNYPPLKEFDTINENHAWHLSHGNKKYPLTLVDSLPQLGDTEYRMKGLLEESVTDLKYSFEKIKEQFQDSN